MRKKKIAVIIASLAGGGVERMMINLVESFNLDSKIDAELVVISDLDENAPQHTLPAGWCWVRHLHAKRVISGFIPLSRLFCTEEYDAIISAQEHVNLIVSWALILSRKKIPFVPVVHNTLSIKLRQSRKLGDHWLVPLCRLFYPRLNAIGAVSGGVKDDLVDFIGVIPERIHLLPNPVVSPEMERDMREVGVTDSRHFEGILSVGRLTHAKGFDILLSAFAKITDQVDCDLMILGEGDQRLELERLVESLGLTERVSLPGFSPAPWTFMKSAKLFVLSSREEGLPTVLIEAMSHGTPVVATNCPSGPREILEDEKYGLLVPVDNASALAQAMLKTLEEPIISPEELIDRGMFYSYENSREAYLALIKKLDSSNE